MYRPVRTLKNVVFPAPLGPIRLDDAALGDGEVDVLDGDQAAEPDGDLVGAAGRWSSTARPDPPARCSLRASPRGRLVQGLDLRALRLVQDLAGAGLREQALATEQHHQHEDAAEDQVVVGREVDLGAELVVDRAPRAPA